MAGACLRKILDGNCSSGHPCASNPNHVVEARLQQHNRHIGQWARLPGCNLQARFDGEARIGRARSSRRSRGRGTHARRLGLRNVLGRRKLRQLARPFQWSEGEVVPALAGDHATVHRVSGVAAWVKRSIGVQHKLERMFGHVHFHHSVIAFGVHGVRVGARRIGSASQHRRLGMEFHAEAGGVGCIDAVHADSVWSRRALIAAAEQCGQKSRGGLRGAGAGSFCGEHRRRATRAFGREDWLRASRDGLARRPT